MPFISNHRAKTSLPATYNSCALLLLHSIKHTAMDSGIANPPTTLCPKIAIPEYLTQNTAFYRRPNLVAIRRIDRPVPEFQ